MFGVDMPLPMGVDIGKPLLSDYDNDEANATKKKNKKATQNKTTTSQKCAFFSLKKKRDYNDIIREKQAEKMTVEEDMFRKAVVVHLGSFCCYLPPEKAKVVTVSQLELQDDLM